MPRINIQRKLLLESFAETLYNVVMAETPEERAANFEEYVTKIAAARFNKRDFAAFLVSTLGFCYAVKVSIDDPKPAMTTYFRSFKVALKKHESAGGAKPTLDLSNYSENLDITSEQFSNIVNDQNLPQEFQMVLSDYCEVNQ